MPKTYPHKNAKEFSSSSLSPCRAVQDIQLEKAEFHVRAIGSNCYLQLIFHGDFSLLRQKILDGTVVSGDSVDDFRASTEPIDFDAYSAHLAYYRLNFYGGYRRAEDYETLLADDTYTLTYIYGYTKDHMLRYAVRDRNYELTDKYWLSLSLTEGAFRYSLRSNLVGGPPQFLEPENELAVCVRELERREQAIALERSRVVQRAAIEAQLEIHTADRDFYVSEITHYQEAIEILKPIIQEANRVRDEALAKAEELQAIYKEHLELIKNFWDDTESAYGDYFNRLIDSQVEINQTVTRISESIESVEQMQADINKLIADAKTKADVATKKIAELGGSDDQ